MTHRVGKNWLKIEARTREARETFTFVVYEGNIFDSDRQWASLYATCIDNSLPSTMTRPERKTTVARRYTCIANPCTHSPLHRGIRQGEGNYLSNWRFTTEYQWVRSISRLCQKRRTGSRDGHSLIIDLSSGKIINNAHLFCTSFSFLFLFLLPHERQMSYAFQHSLDSYSINIFVSDILNLTERKGEREFYMHLHWEKKWQTCD